MKRILLSCFLLTAIIGCKKDNQSDPIINEDASTFSESGSFDVGETGAAEISAFDPSTNKLFVVRNENEGLPNQLNQIEVIDFTDPSAMKSIGSIAMLPFGGAVNSLSVSDGKLAAAVQSTDKQANGKILVFKTSDYSKIAEITVGALPDMVTFSGDGKYIISANEGEPNTTYTNDPSGTVSMFAIVALASIACLSGKSGIPSSQMQPYKLHFA